MVYTPDFRINPAYLKLFTLMARIIGVFWIAGGMFFALNAVVAATNKFLYVICATFLIACGVGLIVAKGPTPADVERWRQRMGFTGSDEQ